MLQAYKYRLKTSKAITEKLLDICRELYNAGLQERREAYKLCGKTITYLMQANQLPAIKENKVNVRRCQLWLVIENVSTDIFNYHDQLQGGQY